MAVEKKCEFDGPNGKVSLLDLFEGRRQLIVYRAFFEPGVSAGPSTGCSAYISSTAPATRRSLLLLVTAPFVWVMKKPRLKSPDRNAA